MLFSLRFALRSLYALLTSKILHRKSHLEMARHSSNSFNGATTTTYTPLARDSNLVPPSVGFRPEQYGTKAITEFGRSPPRNVDNFWKVVNIRLTYPRICWTGPQRPRYSAFWNLVLTGWQWISGLLKRPRIRRIIGKPIKIIGKPIKVRKNWLYFCGGFGHSKPATI